MINLNKIFKKDVTYKSIKSYKKPGLHTLSRKHMFGETTGGGKWESRYNFPPSSALVFLELKLKNQRNLKQQFKLADTQHIHTDIWLAIAIIMKLCLIKEIRFTKTCTCWSPNSDGLYLEEQQQRNFAKKVIYLYLKTSSQMPTQSQSPNIGSLQRPANVP